MSGMIVPADASRQVSAWVNFNGTGTVAIQDSENVSSVTDNASGDWTVNFLDMDNANYVAVPIAQRVSGVSENLITLHNTTQTTSSVRFMTTGLDDSPVVGLIVVGGRS